MYYDHFGEGIADSFSEFGSFGLTTTQAAPSNLYTVDNAPRYTSRTVVPNVLAPAPSSVVYPAFPPANVDTGFTLSGGT